MLNKIFTIFDQKAKAHLPIFMLPTEGMATRTFADCINKPGHQFNAHPADYTLLEIGAFDDETGKVTSLDVSKSYGTGVEFVLQPEGTDQPQLPGM